MTTAYDLERYAAQEALFALKPNRLLIQQCVLDGAETGQLVKINVWRNHAFEPFESLARPYIAFGGWRAKFQLSDYDDSLMYSGRCAADLDLLWLDSDRYLSGTDFHAWAQWLLGRIRALRGATTVPIILATWLAGDRREALQKLLNPLPGAYYADLGLACEAACVGLIDKRTAAMAGTPIGRAAQPIVARTLACQWLPGALFPPIKAIALDLDNTLHFGVLGEDGIQGVQLTPEHRAFQNFIKSLRERGIFIALVSRNERADVEALFAKRDDYPLRWNDFSATEISWGDKTSAIVHIAEKLNIAPDAILFVDDNPGELANVAAQLPQVHTVYAHTDASLTLNVVKHYPGLWRWKVEADDAKRIEDVKSNLAREALLAEAIDPTDYLRSLQVALSYRYNPFDQLGRLADLCNKTNQFNLAIRRFNETEVAERLDQPNTCVASVHLKDRFSDSGVIAVIVAELDDERLLVEELCVSCRAMGRQLEDTILLQAIRDMPLFAGCQEVAFRVRHGPRNQPALDWLAQLLGRNTPPNPGLHQISADRLREFAPADGVTLIKA
jgi:FkbH-like protein